MSSLINVTANIVFILMSPAALPAGTGVSETPNTKPVSAHVLQPDDRDTVPGVDFNESQLDRIRRTA